MKEVSGSRNVHEGPDEHALDEIIPLRAAGNTPNRVVKCRRSKSPVNLDFRPEATVWSRSIPSANFILKDWHP